MKLELCKRDGDQIDARCVGSMTLLPTTGPGDALKQVFGPDCFRCRVTLDLSGVDHVDSSGVSWLLLAHGRFEEAGGQLILHSAVPRVQTLFQLLNLGKVLHLAADGSAVTTRGAGARA